MLCKSHYVFIFYDTATTEIDTYDTLFPYTTLFRSAGISVVLIPMDSDGIEVRPIRRKNGDYHFNEVFFDNVRVPLDNIVGRSEEHKSELQSLLSISYAVFCLKKKHYKTVRHYTHY